MRLDEFMLAAAKTTPDRPAIVENVERDEFRTLTYRQLDNQVREYARALGTLGLDIGDRVILESDTSATAIVAFLACSSLGLAFVPVSPESPDQRLRAIVDTTAPALYVHVNGAPEWLPPETGVVRLGTDAVTVERKPRVGPRRRQEISDTDTAYMIFTSGTTGRPKGVVMSHRGVTSFYRGMLAYSIVGREDRVATTSPLQFDFSLLDIGLALGSGAAVVPVPRDVLRFPRHFLHLLKDAEVTQVNGVPSIWRSVLRHEGEQLAALDRIRGVLFCGEVFPMPELRHLQQLLPAARIVNCYGATESMACSFTDVPRPIPESLEALSIGFAHPGAEMTLVDQAGRPVDESGVVGEIHLRSPALFTGYWGDPEATRAALVPDPLEPRSGQAVFRTGDLARRGDDGELYFCGRADSQVQIRGNRVELGEVERRLLDFPAVTAAAAVVVPGADAAQEGTLSAFVVVESGAAPFDLRELRDFCRLALPAYMIPKAIRTVDRLPVTPNGKTDKAALTKLLVAVG